MDYQKILKMSGQMIQDLKQTLRCKWIVFTFSRRPNAFSRNYRDRNLSAQNYNLSLQNTVCARRVKNMAHLEILKNKFCDWFLIVLERP